VGFAAKRRWLALLIALGVDNFGSGLFLPLGLVYATRVVGLSLGVAGTLVSLGTLAGVASPVIAGRLVDRLGPKPVITGAQLVQALGAMTYLLARGGPAVLVAAMLLAVGQQAFYSSLFALLSDASGGGPRERPFTVANMVRSGCFGLGVLAVAGLLTAAGTAALRAAVAADAGSFLVCAAILALLVRLPPRQNAAHGPAGRAGGRVLADRPFLALIAVTGLVMVAGDFFLSGMPVYVLEILRLRPWLPGTLLAVWTFLVSAAGTAALRVTRRLSRLSAMQLGGALYALGCLASLAAILLPPEWRAAELLAATLVMTAASLVFGARANALAEAAAPPPVRGRYLAAFQYAFTGAGVVAPAVVALYSVAVWLPWVLTAAVTGAAVAAFRPLAGRLPAAALAWEPAGPNETPSAGRGAGAGPGEAHREPAYE
jgi:Na+/melibiose symporter-like transporter